MPGLRMALPLLLLAVLPMSTQARGGAAEEALEAMRRGHALQGEGKVGAACGAFDEAARLLPTWWIARYERARCGRALAQPYGELLAHAQSALAHAPGGGVVWALIGGLHEDAGQTAAAEDAYVRALALDTRLADARLRLATLRLAAGRAAEARELFASFLEREPTHAGAWSGLAEASERLGDAAGMERALLTLAGLSNYPAAVFARLLRLYRERDMKTAARELERAWRQSLAGQSIRPGLSARIR